MSDELRVGLIVGGAIGVVAAIVWQLVRHRRARSGRGLGASDPQERARTGVALADRGLQRSARELLRHVAHEPDPRVRYAIALGVARRDFEPGDTKRVRELRGWAADEIERHSGGVDDEGGPDVGTEAGAAPPPEAADAAAEPAAAASPPETGVQWHAPDDAHPSATS